MHFALSEEQLALQEAARGFLAGLPGPLSMTEQGQAYDADVWHRITVEQGWQAIAVPEQAGGWGFGLLDLTVVFEEAGRAGTPCPLFATVALAITALTVLGSEAQQARWLPRLLEGATASVALHGDVAVRRTLPGPQVVGTARRVVDGHAADLLVASTPDGVFVLDRGLTPQRLRSLDTSRPLSDVRVGVPVAEADRLASDDLVPFLQRATVLLAAESVGLAQACLDTAVDYAKVRVQYGKPIGSFQAIQHMLADVMVGVEAARAATWYAAAAVDQGLDDAAVAVATAKALACDAAMLAAGQSIQVHGGVGFTWEHDAHMRFKRARANRDLLGSPAAHREAVAAAILGGA